MTLPRFWTLLLLISASVLSTNSASFELVSQNLNRLYDDRDDGQNETVVSSKTYQRRLSAVARRIYKRWQLPDIIALQEVENIRILQHISDKVNQRSGVKYQPVLSEGNDVSGIDVGFLVREGLRITRQQALFSQTRFGNRHSLLFSRPPLRIDICKQRCLTVVNVHLRSMRGIASGKKTRYVRQKRWHQARTLARWINRFQQQNPQQALLLVGDFNALTPSDRFVDVVGIIRGQPDPVRPAFKSRDLVEPDLIDASTLIPEPYRWSYRFKKNNQQLDYLLVSHQLSDKIQDIGFGKIDYGFSDHAALQTQIDFDW